MKYYIKMEVEIEAEDEKAAQQKIKECLSEMNYATDMIMTYPSGFFERKMELYRENGVKIY